MQTNKKKARKKTTSTPQIRAPRKYRMSANKEYGTLQIYAQSGTVWKKEDERKIWREKKQIKRLGWLVQIKKNQAKEEKSVAASKALLNLTTTEYNMPNLLKLSYIEYIYIHINETQTHTYTHLNTQTQM